MIQTLTARYRSPIGDLEISSTEKGISEIRFADRTDRKISPLNDHLRECVSQLDEYFFCGRRVFHSLHLRYPATEFQRAVWDALIRVPFGETITYGELAECIGHPGAARAVGTAMRMNPLPIIIPCHRVLPGGGGIGNYNSGVPRKLWLLRHEQAC